MKGEVRGVVQERPELRPIKSVLVRQPTTKEMIGHPCLIYRRVSYLVSPASWNQTRRGDSSHRVRGQSIFAAWTMITCARSSRPAPSESAALNLRF